jgi:hypothetical protein
MKSIRKSQNSILTAIFVALVSCMFSMALWVGTLGNPNIDHQFANYLLCGSFFQSFVYISTVIRREETIRHRVIDTLNELRAGESWVK